MSILKIAKIGHPVLFKKGDKIEQFSTNKLKKIIYDMSETMIDYQGIGLAAPQVHISKRIIILEVLKLIVIAVSFVSLAILILINMK